MFGPPGAGKGTQSNNLVKDFNLFKVSTGELLRKEINDGTNLGNEIKSTIDKGSLVSDNIINDLIENIILDKKINNRLLFDGYPRNLNQAKNLSKVLNKNNQKLSCVLSLTVNKDSLIKRVLGRQTCSKCGKIFNEFYEPATSDNHNCGQKFLHKRSDDNEKAITNRFETYSRDTLPILDFYKEQNLLHQINGMAKIDDISKEIRGIIASIETWLYNMYLYN